MQHQSHCQPEISLDRKLKSSGRQTCTESKTSAKSSELNLESPSSFEVSEIFKVMYIEIKTRFNICLFQPYFLRQVFEFQFQINFHELKVSNLVIQITVHIYICVIAYLSQNFMVTCINISALDEGIDPNGLAN